MKKQRISIHDKLFFITILFFILGIINISLSIIGITCFIIPFILYIKHKNKVWCKYYCPRAGLLQKIFTNIGLKLKLPNLLKSTNIKNIIVIYFIINLLIITMSTIMVSIGRISPIEQVRFLIVFKLPISLPQFINFSIGNSFVHLGYRIYSMMFSTTIIGFILGFLFMPRTWCKICPINTLTTS